MDAVGVCRARVAAVRTCLHGDYKDCRKRAKRRETPTLVDRVPLNPPAASLGRADAIAGGRGRRYGAENVALWLRKLPRERLRANAVHALPRFSITPRGK